MPRVLRAETAGFCMGVDLALRKLNSQVQARDETPIYTFGPIIHNPQVLAHYADHGVLEAGSIADIPGQARVVLRAHGIPRDLEQRLARKGARLVDATCPKVKKAQLLIEGQTRQGRCLLLFGEEEHPEVKGLLSYAGPRALVFGSLEELQASQLDKEDRYFLAAQTTQDRNEYQEIQSYCQGQIDQRLPILDTICEATRNRQQEARKIAKEVDYMIVVGGYTSGNTRRLAQVVKTQGTPCAHIEQASELPMAKLKSADKIGLTAGASTPKSIIDSVEQDLKAV